MFLIGITPLISKGITLFLSMIHIPESLSVPFLAGLFEITLGAQMMAQTENVELLKQVILVSFILAFNGFSVQAQVASILAETDIRFLPYFFARIIHGIFAGFLTVLLFEPLYVNRVKTNLHELPVNGLPDAGSFWFNVLKFCSHYGPMITIITITVGVFILMSRTARHPKA